MTRPKLAPFVLLAVLLAACPNRNNARPDPAPPPPPPAPVIESFTAAPDAAPAGGEVTLDWRVQGATRLEIDNGVGPVSGDGARVSVSVASGATLTLTASNEAGSARASVAVRVAAPEADPPGLRRLKYLAVDGAVVVYDLEDDHRQVRRIPVSANPPLCAPRGIAANAVTDRLYIPYWGCPRKSNEGYMVALDLKTEKVLWSKTYTPSIDSLAITPDGETLYMPSGEERADSDFWFVLDKDGEEKKDAAGQPVRIPVFKGTHNTIVSPDGKRVYLASLQYNMLSVADTATNKVVKQFGPFKDSIRPFAINGSETLAFVTTDNLSGFQVADIATGKVLHTLEVDPVRFPWTEPDGPATQTHGIALSPDETEVWVVDAANKHLHVFDVRGLPERKPIPAANPDVNVAARDGSDPEGPANLPKWINFSRDGRFVHVSNGLIVDAATRKVVKQVAKTRYFAEIHAVNGEPVRAYSRYGLGYVAVPTPADLTAEPGAGSVALRWTSPPGAAGFRARRSLEPDGAYLTVGEVAAGSTSYTDTGLASGATYHYRVTAVNASGEGPASAPASATVR